MAAFYDRAAADHQTPRTFNAPRPLFFRKQHDLNNHRYFFHLTKTTVRRLINSLFRKRSTQPAKSPRQTWATAAFFGPVVTLP